MLNKSYILNVVYQLVLLLFIRINYFNYLYIVLHMQYILISKWSYNVKIKQKCVTIEIILSTEDFLINHK